MSSPISWHPDSETHFQQFEAAIQAADEQLRQARAAVANLSDLNQGLTITALHENFEGELFPQWQAHLSNLMGFHQQAKASYQAAMDQDTQNASRIHRQS